jgi:hypothetical protein
MPTDDTITIPLDRMKLLPIALGSAAFVVLGVGLILISGGESFHDAWMMRLAGAASIAFFGLVFVTVVPKLLDPRPGLVIDKDGILDNSSALSAGMVPWAEITGFEVTTVKSQTFLTILLANPDRFVERGGPIGRFVKRMNRKLYGSPVQISARTLAIGFDQLVALVEQRRGAEARRMAHPTA